MDFEKLSIFLNKLRSIGKYYAKYDDFKTVWTDFITNYPSGIKSVDKSLADGEIYTNGRSSQPYVSVYKTALYLQDLDMAFLTADENILTNYLLMDKNEYKLYCKNNPFIEKHLLERKVQEKYKYYKEHPEISKFELQTDAINEVKKVWNEDQLKQLFDNMPRTELKVVDGFLVRFSLGKYETLQEQCDLIGKILRCGTGVFYVTNEGVTKVHNGACKFKCGELRDYYTNNIPQTNIINQSIYWSPIMFLKYAAYDPAIGTDFTTKTGLEPSYTSINQNMNYKIDDYIIANEYNLKEKPLPLHLCESETAKENVFTMYASIAQRITFSSYVNLHMSNNIDTKAPNAQLNTLPIPVSRENSLLLALADLSVQLNFDPFDGVIEKSSSLLIPIIIICIIIFIIVALLAIVLIKPKKNNI